MKSLLLASMLSSVTFNQDKVNLREYMPIDQLITPQVYVFTNTKDDDFFEKYHAIPIGGKDTLLISEEFRYLNGDLVHSSSTYEIYTSNYSKFIKASSHPEIEITLKGNNKINYAQVVGKEKKYKLNIVNYDNAYNVDFYIKVLNKGFEILQDEVYETITVEQKQKFDTNEFIYNIVLAKGIGPISKEEYTLSNILSEEDFNKIKC